MAALTRSLVACPWRLQIEVDQMVAVVDAVARGDIDAGRSLLAHVDLAALWAYYDKAGEVWSTRHDRAHHRERTPVARATITAAMKAEIARRDHWRCRYCGLRLLAFDVLAHMHEVFGDEFVVSPVKERLMHPVAYLFRYTQDHVVPRSAGGLNTLDNLVACCGTCQFQKGDCTLTELGLSDPRDRHPIDDGWDGLAGRFGRVRY